MPKSVCGEKEVESKLSKVITAYQKSMKEGTLLSLPFTTIFQYLFYLKEIAIRLGTMGSRAMVYLAAAVADFYVSYASMSEHKIQSSGPLEINFSHTPKMVHLLTKKWAPEAFVVTFKLETDSRVLIDCAKGALLKYNHQVVVANLLDSYRTTVTVVTRTAATSSADIVVVNEHDQDSWETLILQLSREDILRNIELEVFITRDLVARHQAYLTQKA